MKLKMHSFDFEECTLTFSVPKEIMHGNSFGNVPGGVEVDLVAITKNAALGIKELAATDAQQAIAGAKDAPKCLYCGSENIIIECGDCKEKRWFGAWSA
jgi:hypothetical protein